MSARPRLLFVSTRFLFPVDSGGKIRTTQILRGMKGGRYHIHLVSPAAAGEAEAHRQGLVEVCDEFSGWIPPRRGRLFSLTRARHLGHRLPIPVRTDWSPAGVAAVTAAMARSPDVAVFDFLHAAVLAPVTLPLPTVMFTHNVEAEIFARHRDMAANPLLRAVWRSQHAKMQRFEAESLPRFDVVVAVSERDAQHFRQACGVADPYVIPTGVDLDYFNWTAPVRDTDVVFCGSMDWLANQEAMRYFLEEVWEQIAAEVPEARMTVVGRAPPSALVERAQRRGFAWRFTGYVDDVRPFMRGAAVSVIPLRVGGGTRLKVYEAMAMGLPVVSTGVGVEGLPVRAGEHYLHADNSPDFAAAVVKLLRDRERREKLSHASREFVESHFSHRAAARAFEGACDKARTRRGLAA